MSLKKYWATGWFILLILTIATPANADQSKPFVAIPRSEFKEITPTPSKGVFTDYGPEPSHILVKPEVRLPNNPPAIIPIVKQSRPTTLTTPKNKSVYGVASFYCSKIYHSRCTVGYSSGMYAAIRKDLLYLRGKYVFVCALTCIKVKIIDCNCGPNANLIDLYSYAFKKLAPLSRGAIHVRVKW